MGGGGVNFCNNVREIKYYFNICGIRKKRKKGAQKKGGGENSPISPPLDPSLHLTFFVHICSDLHFCKNEGSSFCILHCKLQILYNV